MPPNPNSDQPSDTLRQFTGDTPLEIATPSPPAAPSLSPEVVALGEVLQEIKGGGTPSKAVAHYFSGSIPFVTVKDFKSRRPGGTIDHISEEALKASSAELIPPNTVLLTTRMSIGKTARFPYSVAINQDVKALFPKGRLDADYLEWYLNSQIEELVSKGTGTTVKGIRLEDIKNLRILLPPLEEQGRIVAKLDKLFGNTRRAKAELAAIPKLVQRYKQAVLTQAFSGLLTHDWRQVNHAGWQDSQATLFQQQSKANRAALRGSRLALGSLTPEAEALGSLPANWWYARLMDIATIKVGFAFQSSSFLKAGVPLIRGVNVAPGRLDWQDTAYLSWDEIAQYDEYRVQEGDILLAMDRPVIAGGLKVAQAKAGEIPALLVQRVARIRAKEWANQAFVWWLLNSNLFLENAIARATGTDLPHISSNDVGLTPVPIPPLPEQAVIAAMTEAAFGKIERMAGEVKRATALLDRLEAATLSHAFSGRLL